MSVHHPLRETQRRMHRKLRGRIGRILERAKGFEPSTPTLARFG
jgi:hypothetical protein